MSTHPRHHVRRGALIPLIACGVLPAPALVRAQDGPPPAAYSVGMAQDLARERLVVFGGYLGGEYVGNTWEWDGEAWSLRASDGPSARNSPAMVYDEARREVVLFGGDTRETGPLGDTWIWDGETWRRVAAGAGPPPRTVHQMAWDAHRQRVVLFGGTSGDELLGDTWEWDGERWTRVATEGPPGRVLHGLAFDRERGRIVLFGGTAEPRPDGTPLADTWEWDGARWSRIDVEGPSPRDHVAMSYDPRRGAIVLHGGGPAPGAARETWTYDGRSWALLTDSGPPRRYARLAFDPGPEAMVLYGGFAEGPSNELWHLTGTTWRRIAP